MNNNQTNLRFPFSVLTGLSSDDVSLWRCFYEHPLVSYRDSTIEEGLWRRTQDKRNQNESGWRSIDDRRRRMVHYRYTYVLIENESGFNLAISDMYLWWHICMPEREIATYEEHIHAALQTGGWRLSFSVGEEKFLTSGDLCFRLRKIHPADNIHDRVARRVFSRDYRILEATVFSVGTNRGKNFLCKPWDVLVTGIRRKDTRGTPIIDAWDSIKDLFPAQIELGCGPSIEVGLPPLHFLHDVYRVTDKDTGMFILDPYKDSLIRNIAENPEGVLFSFSEMYRRCFMARPSRFHHLLKELYEVGHIVGPVITNNFDGLAYRVGIPELYVRRYDESHIIPDIDFHPRAKSLIVIGSHADRRRIQHAARKNGLRVVYIDPEGYREENGEFRSYPLESLQNGDYLFQTTATVAMDRIAATLL